MANQSGSVYGLTIFCPIINDANAEVSHSLALRAYLAALARDGSGPFAKVSSTHMCRLAVLDDVIYPGLPTKVDHLQSPYLVFESNIDGDLDTYLARMAREAAPEVDAIWSHCVGYPGLKDVPAWVAYMKKCQLTTTFYFADVNDKTVQQTLRALQVQSGLATFIERNQGKSPAEIKQAFAEFWESLHATPLTMPGQPAADPVACYVRSAATTAKNSAAPAAKESAATAAKEKR
jgi:hypothetical protein